MSTGLTARTFVAQVMEKSLNMFHSKGDTWTVSDV